MLLQASIFSIDRILVHKMSRSMSHNLQAAAVYAELEHKQASWQASVM